MAALALQSAGPLLAQSTLGLNGENWGGLPTGCF